MFILLVWRVWEIVNGFKGWLNRSSGFGEEEEGRFVMYNSPCWPPAARIVLLRGLKGDGSIERLEKIGSGEKKKISTSP